MLKIQNASYRFCKQNYDLSKLDISEVGRQTPCPLTPIQNYFTKLKAGLVRSLPEHPLGGPQHKL
jgi:hypothetical protein